MDEMKNTNNAPVNNKGKRVRKKKIRLKKSVRRTTGALLLVTSLIVAAIPTGSASAVTDDKKEITTSLFNNTGLPADFDYKSLLEVTDDGKKPSPVKYNGHYNQWSDTSNPSSIVPNGGETYAYQLVMKEDPSTSTGYSAKTVKLPGGATAVYFEVSNDGFVDNTKIEPMYKLDGGCSQIVECLNPGSFSGTSLAIDCQLGYTKYKSTDPREKEYISSDNTEKVVATYTDVTDGINVLYTKIELSKYKWVPNPTPIPTPTPDAAPDDPHAGGGAVPFNLESSPSDTPSSDNGPEVFVVNQNNDSATTDNNSQESEPEVFVVEDNTSDSSASDSQDVQSNDSSENTEPSVNTSEDNSSNASDSSDGATLSYIKVDVDEPIAASNALFAGKVLRVADEPGGYWDPITVDDEGEYWPKTACNMQAIVTEICNDAFVNIPTSINTITIPTYSTLKKIGDRAFYQKGLTKVDLQGNLEQIGVQAFAECPRLTDVTLGDALKRIGDGAFAIDPISNLTIPYATAKIGCGAFYGTSINNLDFTKTTNTNVGDYIFASCKLLTDVDLQPRGDGREDSTNISNLASVTGLFDGCDKLTSTAFPKSFVGQLQFGTFANCNSLETVIFRNTASDFSDGEFDRSKVTILGLAPLEKSGVKVLKPDATNQTAAYKRCLDWQETTLETGEKVYFANDYKYIAYTLNNFYLTDEYLQNDYYVYTNQYVYDYKTGSAGSAADDGKPYHIEDSTDTEHVYPDNIYPEVILEVLKKKGTPLGNQAGIVTSNYERGKKPLYTLQIDNVVGINEIPVNSIGEKAFQDDDIIGELIIANENTAFIDEIGAYAFNSCDGIKNITIHTNGTTLNENAFSKEGNLEKVYFERVGNGQSEIMKECFYECPKLVEVDFVNDDLRKGDADDYARIKSPIGENAFYNEGRTPAQGLIFKGPIPVIDNKGSYTAYEPFEFAIKPGSVSKNKVFIKYMTGNPQNLVCQYKESDGTNPAGVYLLSYPNFTTELGIDPEISKTEQQTPTLLKERQKTSVDTMTQIELDSIDCTENIIVPKGIKYINGVTSKIVSPICPTGKYDSTYYASHPMYAEDLPGYKMFNSDGNKYADVETDYSLFRYVKDLKSIEFQSVADFPDKTFEGCTDLETVKFTGDVRNLGNLPFYLPDTENDKPDKAHSEASPSSLVSVIFNGEEAASEDNPVYTSADAGLDRIIKSTDASGIVTLEQILPSRGQNGSDKTIKSSELSDVNVIKSESARDCDSIVQIDLRVRDDQKAMKIEPMAFYDCDNLSEVDFPDEVVDVKEKAFGHIYNNKLAMYVSSITTTFDENVFETYPSKGAEKYPYVYIYGPSDPQIISKFDTNYAQLYPNVEFKIDDTTKKITVKFYNADTGEIILERIIDYKENCVDFAPDGPLRPGQEFKEWVGTDLVTKDTKTINSLLVNNTDFRPSYVKTYTVNFLIPDANDSTGYSIFQVATVNEGDTIENVMPLASQMPIIDGAEFKYWSANADTKIYADTDVKAVYGAPVSTHTVNFLIPDKNETSGYSIYQVAQVTDGGTIASIMPDPARMPIIDNSVFKYWNTASDTRIYADTDVKAIYGDPSEEFTVTFVNEDGSEVLSTFKVPGGSSVDPSKAPTAPPVEGKKFHHWSPYLESAVLADTTYRPIYGDGKEYLVKFLDSTGELLSKQKVLEGAIAIPPANPVKPGYDFVTWLPDVTTTPIYEDTTFVPKFVKTPSPTPTTTPTPTPTPTPTTSSSSSSSSSSTSKTAASTSSPAAKSSSAASIATPYYVTSQDAAPMQQSTTVIINNGGGSNNNGNNGSGGTNNGSNNSGSGNTIVQNTRDGISDNDKLTATVNGSTDNFVVKISRTQEADDCALAALQAAYGDITPIRYLPFDISLYDSTGTNKISPLPEGVTVTITMPIPDDLAVYGGNAKVASTVGGRIESLTPRFTMINGVPCMNFTVTHLSPYMVYVDTANLTEAGISDATPKTADPIHPKWFLCIGLAAIALVLLIKKDPEEYAKRVTA